SVKHPNEYRVRRFRDSRSFSHRLVEAFPLTEEINGDDSRPFFRMDCSFKSPEEDPACFVPPMPNVPTAEEVVDTQTFISRLNFFLKVDADFDGDCEVKAENQVYSQEDENSDGNTVDKYDDNAKNDGELHGFKVACEGNYDIDDDAEEEKRICGVCVHVDCSESRQAVEIIEAPHEP
ncbi:hypothetical protein X801_02094, partial [Opisthorchis viverrini]